MLRHEAGDEVINFALPACDRHAAIVGEWKANVKRNQMLAASSSFSLPRLEHYLGPTVQGPFVMLDREGYAASMCWSSPREGFPMIIKRMLSLCLTTAVCLLAAAAYGQDSPSLGDLARQQRQQKEKSRTAQGKDAKASKVITNEEIHAKAGTATAPAAVADEHPASASTNSSNEVKQTAESWTSQHPRSRVKKVRSPPCKSKLTKSKNPSNLLRPTA